MTSREDQRALTPRDPAKIRRADPDYVPPAPRAADIEEFRAAAAVKRGDPDTDTVLFQARARLRKSISKHTATVMISGADLRLVLDYVDAMDGVDHED